MAFINLAFSGEMVGLAGAGGGKPGEPGIETPELVAGRVSSV